MSTSKRSSRDDQPSLFDRPAVIPVGKVRQATFAPEDDAELDDADATVERTAAEPEAARPARNVAAGLPPGRSRATRTGPAAARGTVPAPRGADVDATDDADDEAPVAELSADDAGPRAPTAGREPGRYSAAAVADTVPATADAPASDGATDDTTAAPPRRRKPRGTVSAETLATRQRDISVSEFFAKNRHLLGFDNKRKALLTTVKEAVDNALDACEEAGHLPEIEITIDQLAEDRFRVTVRDNGPGIVRGQIANIFGKLLYGSKFHRLKMARGQQGIGISAAGMYGLLTTGRSVHITSRTSPKKPAHHMQIQMDTTKNRPDVVHEEELAEADTPFERGTEVSIELVATYAKGRQSVDEYLEQTAIANPHALLRYKGPTGEHREFPRASQELPPETREIQPHPHGIELGVLMKMLKTAEERYVSAFLSHEFSRVTPRVAQEICERAAISPKAHPARIGTHEVEKLYTAMQETKIMAPPTDCLAPIGVRALLAGLLKELKAEFYTATTRSPAVYRGNPFQIEVALAFGGKLSGEEPARVIRFANRVPLLYQQSACAAFKSVLDVDWHNYSISQPAGSAPVGPLVIMLHMASVWVPFTSESKEAIADYDEIRKEMKLAIQECGRKLATYLRRRRRQRLESQRRDIFTRYIPDVADALTTLTGQAQDRLLRDLQAIAKARTADADVELDENGKPVEKAADATDEALSGDESIIIVPENEAATMPAAELFEANGGANSTGNGNGGGSRRRRKRS